VSRSGFPSSKGRSRSYSLTAVVVVPGFGCEGTIRTCMNRVSAGYPGQLDDLAILRREPVDTVCFLDKRSNRSPHHSSNFSPSSVNALPPLLTFQTGCRGAIRTPVPGFKVQGPATRRPGITLSAVSLSCTAHIRWPDHRSCDPRARDQYAQTELIRDGPQLGRKKSSDATSISKPSNAMVPTCDVVHVSLVHNAGFTRCF
jgi:hypothetical protein